MVPVPHHARPAPQRPSQFCGQRWDDRDGGVHRAHVAVKGLQSGRRQRRRHDDDLGPDASAIRPQLDDLGACVDALNGGSLEDRRSPTLRVNGQAERQLHRVGPTRVSPLERGLGIEPRCRSNPGAGEPGRVETSLGQGAALPLQRRPGRRSTPPRPRPRAARDRSGSATASPATADRGWRDGSRPTCASPPAGRAAHANRRSGRLRRRQSSPARTRWCFPRPGRPRSGPSGRPPARTRRRPRSPPSPRRRPRPGTRRPPAAAARLAAGPWARRRPSTTRRSESMTLGGIVTGVRRTAYGGVRTGRRTDGYGTAYGVRCTDAPRTAAYGRDGARRRVRTEAEESGSGLMALGSRHAAGPPASWTCAAVPIRQTLWRSDAAHPASGTRHRDRPPHGY